MMHPDGLCDCIEVYNIDDLRALMPLPQFFTALVGITDTEGCPSHMCRQARLAASLGVALKQAPLCRVPGSTVFIKSNVLPSISVALSGLSDHPLPANRISTPGSCHTAAFCVKQLFRNCHKMGCAHKCRPLHLNGLCGGAVEMFWCIMRQFNLVSVVTKEEFSLMRASFYLTHHIDTGAPHCGE